MRHSNAIKNLAIAIEAFSRVPGYDIESLSSRIRKKLDELLTEEETTRTEIIPGVYQAPTPRANSDDIPF